ncbi:MAG: glycosyltransferase, partial [Bacteroidota bacterium]
MKLLVLTSRFPYPIEKGDKLRIYHQIKRLSRNHDVVLCALTDKPVRRRHLLRLKRYCSEVYVYRLHWSGTIWRGIRGLASSMPLQVSYFYNSDIHFKIKGIIKKEKPDRIYCQLLRMAEYIKDLNTPATIDYMDTFSKGMERRAEASAFWNRGVMKTEARKLARYEEEIFARFDQWTIISEQDRKDLPVKGKDKVVVIPNGVDTDYYQPQPDMASTDEVVFVGNMGYFPNVKAAEFLVQEVMPLVWKEFPEMRVLLACLGAVGADEAHGGEDGGNLGEEDVVY